jgi:hypothetical protein
MTLTDEQQIAVRRAIQPLDRIQRDAFLAALNSLFGERRSIGDGELYHMLRELQRIHFAYPMSGEPSWGQSSHARGDR